MNRLFKNDINICFITYNIFKLIFLLQFTYKFEEHYMTCVESNLLENIDYISIIFMD